MVQYPRGYRVNEELRNLQEELKKEWGEGLFKALGAKSGREKENPVVKGRVWSKLNGGTSTTADAIMDSGCTYPISTKTVTDAMKVEIKPYGKGAHSYRGIREEPRNIRNSDDVYGVRSTRRKENYRGSGD